MTKRYDITVSTPEGDEKTHGWLLGIQVKRILDSMPVGASLTVNRTDDSEETHPARIGLNP